MDQKNVVSITPTASINCLGRLLDWQQVCTLTGLSKTTLERCQRHEDAPFPQPVRGVVSAKGYAARFVEAEVMLWIAQKIDADRGPGAANQIIKQVRELLGPQKEPLSNVDQ